MVDVTVILNEAAIAALGSTPEARAVLMQAGELIADAARARAPYRTGGGAGSIHPEATGDDEVGVSWDELHHYMYFHEVGDRYMPARPFLAPAVDYVHF
jgi:HK97 gp10 family phage protein